jgi:hypothetical protein
MNKNNTYMIHLEKDLDKRTNTKEFRDKYNIQLWTGIDGTHKDSKYATWCAKLTVINLLKHFMKTNTKDQYIVIFEDDVILHKDFDKLITQVNEFINSNQVYLFYLGINTKFTNINQITHLNSKNKLSGGYGVIINRDIINLLIMYASDKLTKHYPHDTQCYGMIQLLYPKLCFMMDSPLVIPNTTVSNIRDSMPMSSLFKALNLDSNNYLLISLLS